MSLSEKYGAAGVLESDRGGENRDNKKVIDRELKKCGYSQMERQLSCTITVRDIQETLIANFIPYIDFYLSPN